MSVSKQQINHRRKYMLHFFAKRLNQLHEVKREERGFTLIELLVVVIIIGVLAAIAIPVFLAQREKAWDASAASDARNAAAAATAYSAGTADGTYTGLDLPKLKANGWKQSETTTNPDVQVTNGGKGFVFTIKSASGKTFTFDSDVGRVTSA